MDGFELFGARSGPARRWYPRRTLLQTNNCQKGEKCEEMGNKNNDKGCAQCNKCEANHIIMGTKGERKKKCKACPSGQISKMSDNGGVQTTCTAITCKENQYVNGLKQCVACPAGSSRGKGDDATEGDTSCLCPADFYVSGNQCKSCAKGTTNAVDAEGDGDPAPGVNTECTATLAVKNTNTVDPDDRSKRATDESDTDDDGNNVRSVSNTDGAKDAPAAEGDDADDADADKPPPSGSTIVLPPDSGLGPDVPDDPPSQPGENTLGAQNLLNKKSSQSGKNWDAGKTMQAVYFLGVVLFTFVVSFFFNRAGGNAPNLRKAVEAKKPLVSEKQLRNITKTWRLRGARRRFMDRNLDDDL